MTPTIRWRRRPGIVVAAALVWVPAVVLIGFNGWWPGVPDRLPAHWGGSGNTDSFDSSSSVFWQSLLPAIACGLIAVAVIVSVGNDGSRRASAIGYGVLAGIATATSLQWTVDVLTAVNGRITGATNISTPFLLYLLAISWASLTFLLAFVGSRPTSPHPQENA